MPGRPADYCPVAALPRLSFTGFNQDTYAESALLFPLIRFGKYFRENDRMLLPPRLFVHHVVAGGYPGCKLISDIEDYALRVKELFLPLRH